MSTKIVIVLIISVLCCNIVYGWSWFGFKNDKSQKETDINVGGEHQENKTQTGNVNVGFKSNDVGKMVERFGIAVALIIVTLTFFIGKILPNKKTKLLEYRFKVVERFVKTYKGDNIDKSQIKDFIDNI